MPQVLQMKLDALPIWHLSYRPAITAPGPLSGLQEAVKGAAT
jgi:hypothetical protein